MTGVAAFFFWIIAAAVGISAIMVVATQNIVRCAAWLLFTLVGTSILYFLLNAEFVGATQLIVYVGGTLVLVVFGVMLTAQGPFITMRTSIAEWGMAVVAGFLFLAMLVYSTSAAHSPELPPTDNAPTVNTLGQSFLGLIESMPPGQMTGFPHGAPAPDRPRVAFLLPFELISVHLLVVLIGAAYLARAKRRSRAGQ
jgi:NADH-quinone oxidoreductase subunit J